MSVEVGTAYISILPETGKLTAGMKSAFKGVESDAETTGKKAGGKLAAGLKTAMKGATLATGGLLAAIGGIGIKTAAEFEQTRISLETLMGSSKKAESEMAWLSKKSAATPFDLASLSKADKTLVGFGFNATKTRRQFLTDMGNIAAAVGLPADRLPDLARVFGQVKASGRASMEDINQLVDAGVPVWKALGKATGKTVSEMREDVSKGKISAEVFNGALQDLSQNEFGDAMAKQSMTLSGLWSTLQDNVAIGAMGMVEPFLPLIKQAMPKLSELLATVSKKVATFADYLQTDGIPALKRLGGFVKENKDYFIAIGAALGAAGIAFAAYNAYVKVTTAVTKAWAAVQMLLNGTLRANPVGIVITALALLVGGLVLAYKKSDKFREIVDRAWAGIKKGVKSAWTNTIKPALEGFWTFIQEDLMPTIKSLWKDNIKPVLGWIKTGIKLWWGYVKLQFMAVKFVLTKVLFPVIKWLWKGIIKPVFNLAKGAIKTWWGYVKVQFIALKFLLTKVVFPVLRALWKNVIKPTFTSVWKFIKSTWETKIKPVFDKLKSFVEEKLAPAFKRGVDRVKNIWNGLKAAARKPVEFLVNTVYNKGIRSMMNKIPGVNLPYASFATGGYTGAGSRFTPAGIVHADEFVVSKPSRKKIERQAPGLLDHMNNYGEVPGYYRGGTVLPLAGGRAGTYPGHDGVDLNVGSGWDDFGMAIRAFRDGVISYMGTGRGYGQAVFQRGPSYGEVVYGHMSRYGKVKSGQQVRAGQVLGYVGNTGNSSAPHLHFGHPGGTYSSAMALLNGATSIAGGGTVGASKDEKRKDRWWDVITAVPRLAKSAFRDVQSMGNSGFAGEFKKAGRQALISAVTAADNKIPNELDLKVLPSVNLPDNPIMSALRAVGIFDDGGVLEPGKWAYNASNKPEAVFNQEQFRAFAERSNASRFPNKVILDVDGEQFDAYVRGTARDEIEAENDYDNNRRGAYA